MSHYAYGPGWGAASSGPLNFFKLTMSEGGIRSPMLIAGPGIEGGQQFDSFTYVWDIMPTILDFAGVEHPETFRDKAVERMRGRSLVDALAGLTDSVYGEDDVICGELGGDGMWARQGDMKAVWDQPPYGNERWRLYDLSVDPGETHDLAEQYPEKLEELKAAWKRYADDVGVVLTFDRKP